MLDYTEYGYLFPPRPEKAVPPALFGFYEKRDWTVECKKNGTSNVIFVPPSREPIYKTRHETDHDLWRPTDGSSRAFSTLPGSKWFVFCAELVHSKVKGGPRDTNYVHDCLVYNGHFLHGVPYSTRCQLLESLFLKGGEDETLTHTVVDENTWLAKRYNNDFQGFFDSMTGLEDEGVVIKNPSTPLAFCTRAGSNSSWQLKSRRSTKVYAV